MTEFERAHIDLARYSWVRKPKEVPVKEKRLWKKEWFQLMVLNGLVHGLKIVLENSTNMQLDVTTIQVIVAALSAIRYVCKTMQDKAKIAKGTP